MSLDLVAQGPEANLVRAELIDEFSTRDHDLGDLILAPVQWVTLAVVNPQGQPVVSAKVRPEARRQLQETLLTDNAGQVEINLAVATAGLATIVAKGFATARVELPEHAVDAPIEVILSPACAVLLNLLGPWDDGNVSGDGWRFSMIVVANGSAWHDGLLPPVPGQEFFIGRGPDPLREPPEAFSGTMGTSKFADGTVEKSWQVNTPTMLFDGLRAGHSLRFRVRVDDAPEAFGEPPEDVLWESANVWLADGERRELVVDLRHLQPVR